jgi:predicted phage-related endonuclease
VSALSVPVRQRTPEWVDERRRHLGSSDAPPIAGESGSLTELWAEKRGLIEPEFDAPTADLLIIGRILEASLRRLYTLRTGRPVRQAHQLQVSRRWPVAAASLDGRAGRGRLVEAKWSHSGAWFAALAEGSPDPVPGAVMAQVQWAMYVTEAEVTDVAALVGREFRVIEIGRDDRYIEDLLYLARWFWSFVESGEPPPVDGDAATTATLRRLHPRDDGVWLPPTPDLVALVEQLRDAKATARDAKNHEDTIANALRAILGERAGIEGLVSNRRNADSEVTDWRAVAGDYRAAIERVLADAGAALPTGDELDAIASLHTDTRDGPRVLRLLKGTAR